jgi:transcription elongation factor GreA
MSDQITPEGYEALKAEVAELEGPARREIAERIKTAREWGDLKENSEYHDAKNEQAMLERRIAILTSRLRNAEVVRAPKASGEVAVGTTVELLDVSQPDTPRTLTYRLVGATEADLSEGRLSVESPLAQAALGRRAGDVIVARAPRGERRYEIVSVG